MSDVGGEGLSEALSNTRREAKPRKSRAKKSKPRKEKWSGHNTPAIHSRWQSGGLFRAMKALESREIALALELNQHNRTHTAKALGISRRTLLNKLNEYGLKSRASLRALASETDASIRARTTGLVDLPAPDPVSAEVVP